jgi:hypothetical protein
MVAIASTTLYIVFRNLGREVGSFAFLWAPITLLIIFYKRPTIFFKGTIRILLLYGVLMVGILQYTLWKHMSNWNQVRILYEFYYLFIMTAILMYYWSKCEFNKLAFLSKWSFIFVIITLITTNIALFIDPEVVRQSAATGDFTVLQRKVFKLTGAMDYSYVQAIVCLIPILVYHIKSKKTLVFSPKILIIILILIIVTEIRAQVLANILVTVMITILAFLGSNKRWVSFIAISMFCILLMIIPKSYYVTSISSLSTYFNQNSVINNKLTDFAIFVENPEFGASTETGSRAERYPLLIKALIASPFLGDASYNSNLDIAGGAHLYWMNKLTLWGIPGFLFYIYILYRIFKKISSLFNISYRFYYFLSVVALIFLGLTKVIGGREPWLFLIVIIPGFYFLPVTRQTNNKANYFDG